MFFLGLGDPDELAHHGDYAGYVAALRSADETVGKLVEFIDKKTTIVVTADHGRSVHFNNHGAMPEAARVWMAAPARASRRAATSCSPHPRRLADIAPTLRVVLGMPPDTSERSGAPIDELFDRGWVATAERGFFLDESPTGQITPVPPNPQ